MLSPVIRALTGEDIPQALELSSGAGWNQVAEDWRTIIDLNPESCFAIDYEGQLTATATLCCYDKRLAWLGMVLTKREFQRRGFARMLVDHALTEADKKGIQTVKLDATVQGQPLYKSLGFVAEQDIQRWAHNGRSAQTCEIESGIRSLAWGDFPADRRQLLERLASRASPLGDATGFVMYRDGLHASYLGPCVARSRESAKRLIASALTCSEGGWIWDLLPSNSAAVTLATEFGFRIERRLVRMSRGTPLSETEATTYAIAGFEFG